MATAVSRNTHNKIGTCPHGLPLGACPICNGMGGGGSVKKDNKPREMTWNECYAVGQMLKAQRMARENTLKLFAAQDMRSHLQNVQNQINMLKEMAIKNLPPIAAKVVVAIADKVLTPLVKVVQTISNTIQNLASNISKFVDNLKQKTADIMDKLTAIYGETKASIQKKIDEKFKDLKKKVFNLFGISTTDNDEDEELKRIEEQKRLFELNTAKEALFETFANQELFPNKESEEN